MGKKRDYTKYSKTSNESKESVESTEIKVQGNPIETATKLELPVEVETETITEPEAKVEETKVEEPKYVTGIVTDCVRLNVREDPNSRATILGTITVDTELIVNKEESTEDYYKICTSVGLEGYCMKRFVTIMP